jgi:hypothetical protein
MTLLVHKFFIIIEANKVKGIVFFYLGDEHRGKKYKLIKITVSRASTIKLTNYTLNTKCDF